jgi:transcriptional regulator with XRE-family HTH domain
MAGKEPDVGATSLTVAENVKRLREAQNMNFTQLSERLLAAASWSINAVGIRRIEAGERRITPDDLVALAVAFGVSPVSLLMPGVPVVRGEGATNPSEKFEVTGVDRAVDAGEWWNWLKADYTTNPPSWLKVSRPLWESYALPQWEWAKWSRGTDGDD